MDLKINDVADLLNVTEATIRRWINDGKIPSYYINHELRFSKNEIEDWMISQKLGQIKDDESKNVSVNDLEDKDGKTVQGNQQFSLFRAIHKGGVFTDIPGDTKEELIRNSCNLIAQRFDWDADALTDLLLDRERLMPTALNNGIGVPHARDLLLNKHYDAVAVVFPKKPIEYGALDNKPVHTLFFLFACEDKNHLRLLAKLAHLSSKAEALNFLQLSPSQDKLLSYIKEWEGAKKP